MLLEAAGRACPQETWVLVTMATGQHPWEASHPVLVDTQGKCQGVDSVPCLSAVRELDVAHGVVAKHSSWVARQELLTAPTLFACSGSWNGVSWIATSSCCYCC